MRLEKDFLFIIVSMMALSGWGVLTYIVLDSIPKGGYYIATNLFFEMWIEAILFPLFLILIIISMIFYLRDVD